MHEDAAGGRIAHRQHASAHPFVPNVIGPAAPLAVAIQPGIVIPGAQNQSIELLRAAGAEHGRNASLAGPSGGLKLRRKECLGDSSGWRLMLP